MRIGIDCRLWEETGVGRYIRNLVEQLTFIDQENSYILFALPECKEQIKKIIENKGKFTIIEANIHWHSIEEQLLFPQIIKDAHVNLMHFPYFSVPLVYNAPFIVTIHDLIINHYPTGKASTLPFPVYYLKRYAYKFVIANALKKSKKIIVPLHAVSDDVTKLFHIAKSNIVVTYEGASDMDEAKIKKDIVKDNIQYFLHVGNVYPHKNCEKLIDAFALFIQDYPNVQLFFIGRNDYFMNRLRRYIEEKNLQKNVNFLGKVTDDELYSYYKNAIALEIPSLMEGFGLPALEAMNAKCLVLASDIPSLREVCEDVAIYYNPKSISDIANGMRKAIQLATKEKEHRLQKGLEKCKQFSWQKMALETRRIYESCSGV